MYPLVAIRISYKVNIDMSKDKKTDDKAKIIVEAHVVIRDKTTKKELINKRA